jgi:ABC-type phosphate transport system auxiliary subunit
MQERALMSPEERELTEKQVQLTALESQLAERELALATLQSELRAFEARYIRIVGSKFARRDDLEARIAEELARLRPADDARQQAAAHARERARETAAASSTLQQREAFTPSDQLKALYREAAKRVHPDLANDSEGRTRRTRIMAAVNAAYAAGDEARLRELLEEWDASPESVAGNGVAAELVRTIRKIHQVRQRLSRIEAEIVTLEESELATLREAVLLAESGGRDLLQDMGAEIGTVISRLEIQLNALISQRAPI